MKLQISPISQMMVPKKKMLKVKLICLTASPFNSFVSYGGRGDSPLTLGTIALKDDEV